MRKIGLDIGSKSCGIAVSDYLGITAQGKENFNFELKDWDALLNKVDEYVSNGDIDTIVVGYPTYPSGDKSETTYMIEEVIELIKKRFTQPVVLIDENGTTKRAHQVMIDAGLTRKKRKEHKDKLAAVLILEDYLMRL